jgi:DNA replication and repair protein RecF
LRGDYHAYASLRDLERAQHDRRSQKFVVQMYIKTLSLYQFRNLRDSQYAFPPGVVCVVGDNGQGKTNLIEAISLLSLTRSFRTASIQELIRWGADSASVFSQCIIGGEARELGISISDGERKTFIDGKEADSITQLIGKLLCVTFSPTDISLVKGAPQERRRFIDRHIVDLDQSLVGRYIDYQKALRSKQALLKSGAVSKQAIDAWNEVLIPAATAIVNGRIKLLKSLQTIIAPVSQSLFGASDAITLKLSGISAGERTEDSGDEITINDVAKLFTDAREREIAQGRAVVGPHRDDLLISLNGKDARAFASQGQSRSIVLALKLAIIEMCEAKRNDSPIVLLDDVDSELDGTRRAAIFGAIFEKPRQVFITATEFRLPPEVRSRVSEVLVLGAGELQSRGNPTEFKSEP